MQCETPALHPLPCETGEDEHGNLYRECPHCNVVTICRANWEGSRLYLLYVLCFPVNPLQCSGVRQLHLEVFNAIHNKMAMVDVDDSSLPADSQPKSIGLV